MLDGVVECLVKRNNTMGTYIARFFMFLLDGILLAASLFVLLFLPAFFILICVFVGIGWFVTWLIIRYTRVEFEYSYFDEELTVDKIYNKSKRKRIGRFSFAKLEYFAPADSPRFNKNMMDKCLVVDCSAKDPDIKDYTFYIMDDGKKPTMLTISPNEEMMAMINKRFSRKMVE